MSQTAGDILNAYKEELTKNIQLIDENTFQSVIDIILEAYKNDRTIFIMGNGGSAGTANHFVCDFGKGLRSSLCVTT